MVVTSCPLPLHLLVDCHAWLSVAPPVGDLMEIMQRFTVEMRRKADTLYSYAPILAGKFSLISNFVN